MKRFMMMTVLAGTLPFAATAQSFGAEFLSNWDLNADGHVTEAEVLERRGDLFYMFDADENGRLSDEEYAMFDETRALDRQMHLEEYSMTPGQNAKQGQKQGLQQGQKLAQKQGNGPGKGTGHGPGNGPAFAAGIDQVQGSMTRLANDLNGDGIVTREEFIGNGTAWFARMDRTHDGRVTLEDFGG